jgi:hypothetical protein
MKREAGIPANLILFNEISFNLHDRDWDIPGASPDVSERASSFFSSQPYSLTVTIQEKKKRLFLQRFP